jgi:glycosyltransferase involved in cell wall biosynthesis
VSLSVAIMTLNEEQNLPRCLGSVEGLADQIVVLDSHSTDRTRDIAREAGAEVHEEDWAGFVEQRAHSIELASSDWVLCLDADEWLDEAARAAVRQAVSGSLEGGPEGYELNRRTHYMGAWIDHCGWSPEWRLRLVRKGCARMGGVSPHARIDVAGRVERLAGRLNHLPYRSLAEHLGKVNRYTDEMADRRYAAGERASLGKLVLRPPARFLRMYLLKAGFLDGWRGLVVSSMGSFYVFLKYAKLLALSRADDPPAD